MLYNPLCVSFHPQLHACPLQAGHISIRVSQNYPSNHRTAFCKTDLVFSWGESEILAVRLSCKIDKYTYLYNILRHFTYVTFLAPKELTFYLEPCERKKHMPRSWRAAR